MTKGQASLPTPQGGTTPAVPRFAHLYETRHGLFAGPRTLWDEGEPAPAPAPSPAPAPAPAPADQGTGTDALNRALAGLLSRHGSTDAVALHLLNENHALREQRRTLQGRLPAEGAVVLSPEQAQQWQAYQQLGDDPAALRTRLEQGAQAAEREQARELAQVSGANPDILSDLLRVTGLRAEVRDVPAAGDQPARREVHLLGAEGQDQGELRAYVQQHRAAYVPALFPATPPQGGTVVSPQAGAGSSSAPTTNPFTAALQGTRPQTGTVVVSAFDLTPTPTGGTT